MEEMKEQWLVQPHRVDHFYNAETKAEIQWMSGENWKELVDEEDF